MSIINAKCKSHELREDGGAPRPSSDHVITTSFPSNFSLSQCFRTPLLQWVSSCQQQGFSVMIMDNPSTQIRVVRPIAADRAEVTVYCIASPTRTQTATMRTIHPSASRRRSVGRRRDIATPMATPMLASPATPRSSPHGRGWWLRWPNRPRRWKPARQRLRPNGPRS